MRIVYFGSLHTYLHTLPAKCRTVTAKATLSCSPGIYAKVVIIFGMCLLKVIKRLLTHCLSES